MKKNLTVSRCLLWQGDKEPKEDGKSFAVLVTQAGN